MKIFIGSVTYRVVFTRFSTEVREVPMGQGPLRIVIPLVEDVIKVHRICSLAAELDRRLVEQVRCGDSTGLGSRLRTSCTLYDPAIVTLDCVAETTLVGARHAVDLTCIDRQLRRSCLLPVAFQLFLADGLALARSMILGCGWVATRCFLAHLLGEHSLLSVCQSSAALHELIRCQHTMVHIDCIAAGPVVRLEGVEGFRAHSSLMIIHYVLVGHVASLLNSCATSVLNRLLLGCEWSPRFQHRISLGL